MPNVTDISSVAKIVPSENPWMQPPLRKLSNEIHDSATQMMILGKLIVAHGDLLEAQKLLLRESIDAMRESTEAIKQLTKTIKETLG